MADDDLSRLTQDEKTALAALLRRTIREHSQSTLRAMIVFFALASPCLAQEWPLRTGMDVYRWCNDASDSSVCMAYLRGIAEGIGIADSGSTHPVFCLRRIEVGQLRLIFNKWASDNPASLDRNASLAVMAALAWAFPCPRQSHP
jgi:hypothetical protein